MIGIEPLSECNIWLLMSGLQRLLCAHTYNTGTMQVATEPVNVSVSLNFQCA